MYSQVSTVEFTGFREGPMMAESYKRTVYRPPPAKFNIEMLPPTKIDGSYSYGMRICPLIHDHLSPSLSESSTSEYEVWRRWEDCLIFQGDIEEEYRRLALAKRNRLVRGQGVKRAGFYKQDAASSWESLPPGPDPKSVGREIYQYIPMLTRKGTVFRASQATIEKRAVELKAFIEAIWKDDVPALIDEMRNDSIIRDFFGYWRHDYEFHEKQRKQRMKYSSSRTSMSSSIFSVYFSSSSNPSLPNLNESIPTSRSIRSRNGEAPRYRKGSASSSSSEGSPLPHRRRAGSTSSSNSSPSTPSDSALNSPAHDNVPMPSVADEAPTLDFHHNPHRSANYDRPISSLTILPEDRELCLKTDAPLQLPPVGGKRRKSSLDPDRQGRIFLSTPDVPSSIEQGRPSRNSWQSIDSAACVLEGLDYLSLPVSPAPSVNRSHRESTSSIATFMTDATADGVLPQERLPSPSYSNLKLKSRIVSGPVSISDFNDNEWSDPDADADDILDMFLTTESFPIPAFDIPHIEFPRVVVEPVEDCPVTAKGSDFSTDGRFTPSKHRRTPGPGSAATSTTFASSKSMTPIPDKFTIKAKFNDSLIILRVSDDISYKDLRQNLFNKFVGQEGVALSEKFKITFLQPLAKPATIETADIETADFSRPPSSDVETHVHYSVTSAADWENVAASIEGYRLTFLITDDTL